MKKLLTSLLLGTLLAFSVSAKSLVVYFSVATNTAIIAKMIAEETGADLFEIQTVKSYPIQSHDALLNDAKDELNKKASPALKSDVKNFADYDTVYIGYPIWWGDLPMPVYTFLEAHSWSGKTVIPFCTHGGSGLAGTERTIRSKCGGATALKGLAVSGTTAQNNRNSARKSVQSWLKQIGK